MSNSKPNSLVYIVVDFNSSKMRGSKRPLRFHHINFPRHTTWKRRPSVEAAAYYQRLKCARKLTWNVSESPWPNLVVRKCAMGGGTIFSARVKTRRRWVDSDSFASLARLSYSRGIGLLGDQSTWSAGAHERESRCQLAVDLLVVISCFWERKKFSPKH